MALEDLLSPPRDAILARDFDKLVRVARAKKERVALHFTRVGTIFVAEVMVGGRVRQGRGEELSEARDVATRRILN